MAANLSGVSLFDENELFGLSQNQLIIGASVLAASVVLIALMKRKKPKKKIAKVLPANTKAREFQVTYKG